MKSSNLCYPYVCRRTQRYGRNNDLGFSTRSSSLEMLSCVHTLCLESSVFIALIIQANLLGSSLGLWSAYYMEKYYRHRREVRGVFHCSFNITNFIFQIARLYRPLDTEPLSDEDDDDPLRGTQLLPTHNTQTAKGSKPTTTRMTDVWDEQEELFGIGDDSDDDEPPRGTGAGTQPGNIMVPKILVTPS